MLIISHRGYHVDVPENTIEAFEQALSMGVDGIETDVRLSADGVPILFHDRLAGPHRDVSSLTKAELQKLAGYPVATLAELEELIARSAPQKLWNLEIKEPEALKSTLSLVSRLGGTARFLITSFKHPVILEAAAQSKVDCGFLVSHYPLLSSDPPDWPVTGPNLTTMVWNFEETDGVVIQQSAQRGFRNFIYGAVSTRDHSEAAAWGIDGVITDHPEYLL